MKSVLFVLAMLFVGGAQAQVLGEIKGQGPMQYTQSGETRQGTCDVAMNVRSSATAFSLEFSVFECGALGVWNDPYVSLTVQGDQLVDGNGTVVGEVYADGTYKFTLGSEQVYEYTQEDIDQNCRVNRVYKRTVKLETKITYTVRHVGGGHYVVTRDEHRDSLTMGVRKVYPQCRGISVWGKSPINTNVHFVLR